MKRALLISIHPEWAEKILNGEKTIEIRTWIPKGELPLEVLIYVAKREPYLAYDGFCYDDSWGMSQSFYGYQLFDTKCELNSRDDDFVKNCPPLNGKVVAKFILNKVEKVTMRPIWGEWEVYGEETDFINLSKKSCLTQKEIMRYLKGKVGYAWHIGKLEIFDKPKELSEFIHYRKETIYCGMDCPPYTDWVEYPVRKAPQKCAWVYIDEKPEPHQVSVLDEETPNKKDESERKPF